MPSFMIRGSSDIVQLSNTKPTAGNGVIVGVFVAVKVAVAVAVAAAVGLGVAVALGVVLGLGVALGAGEYVGLGVALGGVVGVVIAWLKALHAPSSKPSRTRKNEYRITTLPEILIP